MTRGEDRIARCLREAREHVEATEPHLVRDRFAPYGSNRHPNRRAYDLAVQTEFHARLVAAGIPVEGL